MNCLHERIIEISKKYHLSHLGSNLTSVDIIDEIYKIKFKDEPFVLSMGHAGLALYVILEKYYGSNHTSTIPVEIPEIINTFDAEKLYLKHGIHPYRDPENKIYCSTGSLGMGLPIAIGMALSDRSKNVYCLVSDGECYEGSIWEALNVIKRYEVNNLKVYINFNGWSAYHKVEGWLLNSLTYAFPFLRIRHTSVQEFGMKGLEAHYKIL